MKYRLEKVINNAVQNCVELPQKVAFTAVRTQLLALFSLNSATYTATLDASTVVAYAC